MLHETLRRKLEGYCRRVRHETSMWRHRRRVARNERCYESWIDRLRREPPDVFLGPDLAYGGVRGHVRAIKEHSSLRIQLVPDEAAMGGLENFTGSILERFMDFDPEGSPCVHSHVMPWFIRWCRRQQDRGLTWVHTYHLPYFPDHGRKGMEPWQEEINDALIHEACHADIRLSVSRWQQDYMRNEHGIETDYLPNGVDVAACDKGNAERFRRKFNIVEPFLLFVGRNQPVKNPAEFVALASAMQEHRFVMIGGGLLAETPMEGWERELPNNLTLLGGLDHSAVQDALAACAVLVAPSKREGLPTLVLESMVHQKPTVVADEPGCMEAINGGEFGFSFRLGDLASLKSAVQNALNDHERSSVARGYVLAEYDWNIVGRKLDKIYTKLAQSRNLSRNL